jgi:hypothetical protein
MRRVLRLCLPLGFIASALGATAGQALASGAPAAMKGHFEYVLFDPQLNRDVQFVCDETRIQFTDGARESIHCKTDDRSNRSAVIFSPQHLFGGFPWFSDFTGEQSKDFHLVGTPSGNLDGWATY